MLGQWFSLAMYVKKSGRLDRTAHVAGRTDGQRGKNCVHIFGLHKLMK